jgi:hypothetical protein
MRRTKRVTLLGVALLLVTVAVAVAVPAAAAATSIAGRQPVSFGINVPGDSQVLIDQAAGAAGARPSIDNIFVKLDSSFGTATLQRIAARGMQPMVTLEPWSWRSSWGQAEQPRYQLKSITAGAYDVQLRAIATAVAGYRGQVILRYAHEMNGWWYPWSVGRNGNTAADYRAAWRHVRLVFRASGAVNAAFLWSPNALTGSGQETRLETAYPGDPYVDLIGMTAYGHGASPSATFDATYARLVALTPKPVLLSETGVDGAAKATWIAAFGTWLARHDRVAGFIWYNTTPSSTGASGDYRFDDTPANAAAFRQSLAGLRLAGVP